LLYGVLRKKHQQIEAEGGKGGDRKASFFSLHNLRQEIAIGDNDTGNVVLLSSGHQM
jgi:hypothetical protein